MADLRPVTCCFSGYRIEKMPFRNEDCPAARAPALPALHSVGRLQLGPLFHAIRRTALRSTVQLPS